MGGIKKKSDLHGEIKTQIFDFWLEVWLSRRRNLSFTNIIIIFLSSSPTRDSTMNLLLIQLYLLEILYRALYGKACMYLTCIYPNNCILWWCYYFRHKRWLGSRSLVSMCILWELRVIKITLIDSLLSIIAPMLRNNCRDRHHQDHLNILIILYKLYILRTKSSTVKHMEYRHQSAIVLAARCWASSNFYNIGGSSSLITTIWCHRWQCHCWSLYLGLTTRVIAAPRQRSSTSPRTLKVIQSEGNPRWKVTITHQRFVVLVFSQVSSPHLVIVETSYGFLITPFRLHTFELRCHYTTLYHAINAR